jgi:hypothetical protein
MYLGERMYIKTGDLVRAELFDEGRIRTGLVVRGGKQNVMVQFSNEKPCWVSIEFLEVISESR